MSVRRLFAGALLCAALGGCDATRPVVDFAPRFGAERTTTYAVSVVNQHEQAVALGGGNAFLSELTCVATLTVEPAADGGAVVGVRLSEVVHRVAPNTAEGVDFVHSRPDEQNRTAEDARALRGLMETTALCRVDARGGVVSVTGLEGLLAQWGETARGRRLAGVFHAEWFRGLVEEVFLVGGESARRRLREEWTTSRVVTAPTYPTTTTLTRYRLAAVTPARAEIDVSGSIGVDFAPDTTAAGTGAEVEQQFLTGKIAWDRGRGRLAESESRRLVVSSGEWQEIGFARRYVTARTVRRVSGSETGGGGGG